MSDWPAIAAARAHDGARRVPFSIEDRVVGSVDRGHLAALRAHADVVSVGEDGVAWKSGRATRDADLARINAALHADGLIIGWRDEPYVVVERPGSEPLAIIERTAARFWGTLTFGAHANGYLADDTGRPTHLWIARRSFTKPTDPGLLDNLVGGGVPAGQTPRDAVIREGWEEAGLMPQQMTGIRPGRVMRLERDIAEGRQLEWLYAFDLALPADAKPVNQDGEVAELHLIPIQRALALAATDQMTVDAALVTLDFALRHRLLGKRHQELQSRFQPLPVDPALT